MSGEEETTNAVVPELPLYTCKGVWKQMTKLTSIHPVIHNFHCRIDMSGSYTVITDLFPREALKVYSNYNMGREICPTDKLLYFSAHRGGSQGDYREGMIEKIQNVVDCLKRFHSSKRAVITVPNNSMPSHESDDDAKCLREIHFHLEADEIKADVYTLHATAWMRAQAAEIFPKNIHFIGSLMTEIAEQLSTDRTVAVGVLFYLATTLVSDRS